MDSVDKVLKSLTLEQKASLCQGATSWLTKEIDGVVPSVMMTDGPHGLRKQEGKEDMLGLNPSKPATCFPSAAALCNSWDEQLICEVGAALGEEALSEGISVVLGPGVNIKRSPLCGRNFEYFSEDPYLASNMAKSHILGLQSKGVGASIKHFAVNNQETERMRLNVNIDERALREIYLAAFETAVKEAKPYTVMAAYNKINGEFCCENKHLLQEILRDEWGYDGVVVSDWGATNDQVKGIANGFDLRMPYCSEKFNARIVDAVKNGELDESDLDNSVRRILTLIKKGIENRKNNYACDLEKHTELAVKAAAESAVLLKNDGVLPLTRKQKIAVIGGFAKNIRFQGGGSSHVNALVHKNILEVLDSDYPDVRYTFERGYRIKKDEVDGEFTRRAVESAQNADVVVMCLGLPDRIESEGFDRKDMRIPTNQIELVKAISAVGKPIVALLFAGAPVETDWDSQVNALFAMYTAGQGVASAAAKLLFGDVNPSGKLAETYPIKLEHTPTSLNYPQKRSTEYSEGIYVGYRYYDKKDIAVKYPFGHGLSYTTFEYGNVKLDKKTIKDTETLTVSVDVKNIGSVAGAEIVQLYVSDVECSVHRPIKELKGFTKIMLNAGEKRTVKFILDKRSFAFYDTEMKEWNAESGEYKILIGASSRDIRTETSVIVESTADFSRTYDEFVTMREIMAHPKGYAIFADMIMSMVPKNPLSPEEQARMLDDEDCVVDIPMDMGAMGMDMPLRKTADMAGDMFPEEFVQYILSVINGK